MTSERFRNELEGFVLFIEALLLPRKESLQDWFRSNAGLNPRTLYRWRKGGLPTKDNWSSFSVAARNLGRGVVGFDERLERLRANINRERRVSEVLAEGAGQVKTRSSPKGFALLTDGIIVSLVGELIQNDGDTREIRQQCRQSYQRCLEDFAFALVYGSKIVTSKDFRPSVTKPTQPGKELATRLGEICETHVLEDDLKDGALLAKAANRELIKKDFLSFADCLGHRQSIPYFHDWLAREAKIHLGTDSSLFREGMEPEKYLFDVVRPYYRDRLLQEVLDVKTIERLVSFLPKSPGPNGDPYATGALKEFATRNVLTLMTIDQEYNESAVRNGKWRMPHITRSLVKQGSIDRQEYLRDLVTLNALVAAFRHTKREKPHMLLTILVDLRDRYPFKRVRQVLERENLLVLEPNRQKEEKAQKLIALINSHAKSVDSGLDRFLIERRAALRRLSPLLTREYEHELCRIFPDLTPSPGITS
jgi:hypothetical protein